ncbi:hypothetical protein CFIO01_00682 [Colletotrichum fioriniae PJ7]|uniref:Uncharacterized protein n=1 Tax=Colletotrichum fioriniae PJ7 TaxID=1445577 RepID=A0A010R478_9PEZI|nr:hypothetical protein CFIO01_00682 [Colletotrichum fioriniae PJ7]
MPEPSAGMHFDNKTMAPKIQGGLQIRTDGPKTIPKPGKDEKPDNTHLGTSLAQSLRVSGDAVIFSSIYERVELTKPDKGDGTSIQQWELQGQNPRKALSQIPARDQPRISTRIRPMVRFRPAGLFLVLCLLMSLFSGAMADPVPSESSGDTETRSLANDSMLDKVVGQLDLNLLTQVLLCLVLGGWLVVIRYTRQDDAGFWALLTASLTHVCFVHDPKANGAVCLLLSLILVRINQSFTLSTVAKYEVKLP